MKAHFLASLLTVLWITGCAFNDQVKEPDSSMTYSRRAYHAGRAAAERDIKHGILAVESAGLRAEWSSEYVRLLKQRYGIEDRGVAGCIVDDKIIGHMRGYNEVSDAEITRRFGPNVFERTAKEARALYKKKYPLGRY
jgi:hypothetical protein